MTEVERKEEQIRALMDAAGLDALLLQRVSSFAWATDGGQSYIDTAVTNGTSQILYTPDGRHLITTNIERPRLLAEEGLADQGWTVHAPHWYRRHSLIADLTAGMALGADGPLSGATDLSPAIVNLRMNLSAVEQERFRTLGRISAEAMHAAVRRVQPGQSEFAIAAILAEETQQRGAQPIVNLVATDETVFHYRHPLPTQKTMDQYAMLVLCARKWGLVVSITRLVHYGLLPRDLRQKMEACARVDAATIAATRPGITLNRVFGRIQEAYAAVGYDDEWQLHHQGGPAGYESREVVATPDTHQSVRAGQVYAWNPSITGVKSEDTVLVGESHNQVLTTIDRWPTVDVSVGGTTVRRPAILEIV